MAALVVLVVDDDARNRKLARDVLEHAGLETLGAASGEEALLRVRERLPDVVLLDVRLPDTDGGRVAQELKADPATANIPVVALTALDGARAALIAAGFDDCLEKPIDVLALPDQVRRFSARNREAGTLDDPCRE